MATNDEEPMDLDTDPKVLLSRADRTAVSLSDQPHSLPPNFKETKMESREAAKSSPKQNQNDGDVAELKVSVTWVGEFDDPKKFKNRLTKTLQSWANKNRVNGNFTATDLSDDGTTAVISVTPAAALPVFLSLGGQEFTTRENNKFSFKPIIENDVNKTSQIDQKSSAKSSPKLSTEDHVKSQESSADDDNDKPVLVALGHYWYMKNSYPDEIERIERQNGVKITENVAVSVKAEKKRANPQKASDEFTNLVQSCFSESVGVSIPFKKVGPEEWKDTLKFLQMTDHKCQITISSDKITISGPQQYQTAISKSLQRTKISTNLTDEERVDHKEKMYTNSYYDDRKTPNRNKVRLNLSIKDPLVVDGLPVENDYWEIMTNQHKKELSRIKEKFNVRFKEVEKPQGIREIKVRYNGAEGNMQMESHGVRALLRLYQKVATLQFIKNNGTFDGEENLYSSFDDPKGAAGQTDRTEEKSTQWFTERGAVKKQSGAEAKKNEKEEEEDTCPVCLDAFTKKTILKSCKHEFCEECLERSVKSQGAMCPVCKDVFGLVEGDQPHGTMTWLTSRSSLPGYESFGRIEINYNIPNGTQTAKHPNPGHPYFGLNRTAYLPDNKEGNEVLQLLKRAFDQKLIFTVGTSRTTGADNVVTWNDIHHKTSTHGGAQSFGYPDPDYLSRVKDELKAKGIK